MNSYSEVNKTKKNLAKESLCSVPIILLWRLGCSSHFAWVIQPKKVHIPQLEPQPLISEETYPANSAFIGDQNLLTLGNIQFGQGLNDGIFIRAWKEPMKTSQAACTRTRGLLWPCPGCAIGHTALHTSLHNLGLICAQVPQPSSATPQEGENKSLTEDVFMAKTWISWRKRGGGSSCPIPSNALTGQWGDANG